jgi:hypothetical protein
MAGRKFSDLVASGLLREVEEVVVSAYLSAHPGATRPDAYHWLHYEDPAPVERLVEGVRTLRSEGVPFDARAVDKACALASKMGYPN